jgi:hypothetical protein
MFCVTQRVSWLQPKQRWPKVQCTARNPYLKQQAAQQQHQQPQAYHWQDLLQQLLAQTACGC